MELVHLELLRIQRELYAMPRGMERLRSYLAKLTVFACLYGDEAAVSLGCPPLGSVAAAI